MYSVAEDEERCPESRPSVVVTESEVVARLLHEGIAPGGHVSPNAFRQDDLMPCEHIKSGRAKDHECGQSAGMSLTRCPPASEMDLLAATIAIANGKAAHFAAKARAGDLRQVSVNQINGQLVFLMADGSAENPGHCVLRLRPDLETQHFKQVRNRIVDIFRAGVA